MAIRGYFAPMMFLRLFLRIQILDKDAKAYEPPGVHCSDLEKRQKERKEDKLGTGCSNVV